jgi:2-dehydro-3-deoxyphosphogluconate aldolase / (4S)-4-hydroxy-2-oxoglutarate aldolase
MARYSRLEVLNAVVESGFVPIFYNDDVETTRQITAACAAGGARLIEFTNRGDFAVQVFSESARYFARQDTPVMLGIGSIVDAPTAALYIANGANFVVGPIFNAEVARLCNRRKVAYFPGCSTLSEISEAEEFGVEVVKVFPGESVGGPDFVKAILGPSPWTRVMVTGGVAATPESLAAWFKAGVTGVGIGSDLIRKDWIKAGQYDAITEKTAQILAWIQAARN